jgi:hypothetical protein
MYRSNITVATGMCLHAFVVVPRRQPGSIRSAIHRLGKSILYFADISHVVETDEIACAHRDWACSQETKREDSPATRCGGLFGRSHGHTLIHPVFLHDVFEQREAMAGTFAQVQHPVG